MNAAQFYDAIGGDYADALGRLMNDAMILRFVQRFPSDPSFTGLQQAVEASDWDTAFSHAHALKGVALNLSFALLGKQAVALTDALRPQNRERLEPAMIVGSFGKVKTEYDRVIDAIARI